MGVGPTLLGGTVGAAVGVALHTVLETGMLGKPIEASWFAIVIGLLTGLGVRQANRTHMERSYLRGAISGIIALAAIYGSTVVIAEVMKKRDQAMKTKPAAAAPANANAASEADESDAAETPAVEPPATNGEDRTMNPAFAGGVVGNPRAGDLNPWQFVFMALGALVAYEFGRGAGAQKMAEPTDATPPEGMGRATDPSE
ncbi:MAG: hypothetical protein JNL18_23785 [Planctomycetaceae bacterium]|uniref:Uncharacterized protein n=1 Tax=Lacipirellula limnantheis TaxID=2528024 RepID=A0A517TSQ0_9BACT|nr:hypothetical protein [Lacipirellula limnantheis]MBL9165766.1 hypothetical protein [Planctomycetaceae bacterium]QDT71400.1 hypothetical protein I41_05570 [Lacipirellula limnantheis]